MLKHAQIHRNTVEREIHRETPKDGERRKLREITVKINTETERETQKNTKITEIHKNVTEKT